MSLLFNLLLALPVSSLLLIACLPSLPTLASPPLSFSPILLQALEIVPYTLAENAGMHPIAIVTELRKRHAEGMKSAGINVKKSTISDILEENVLQPLLVSTSAIALATETVRMILKIDDIVAVR